jgi:translocation and assembly module TamB
MEFTARGDQRGSIQVEGRVRSGGGELRLSGSTPTQPTRESPGRLELAGENFLVSNNSEAEALITPKLNITLIGDTILVRGQVDVPLARIELNEMPQTAIKPSDDVILIGADGEDRGGRPIRAEVRVALGDSVSFRGFNFDAELGGSLLVMEIPERPAQATGTLVIEEGQYSAYGQALTVTNGLIRFSGPLDNPALNIRAARTASDSMHVGLAMTGTLKEPEVQLYSDRPMAQAQILSYMVTGGPVGGSGSAGNLINKTLSALGLSGGSQLVGAVGEDLGLENVRLETTGDLQDASLVLGRFLSPRLYISYGVGLFDPVSTLRLRYVLSSKFTIQAEAGGKSTGGDALFRIRK